MDNMLTTAPTQRNSLESLDAVYLGNITPCKGAFKLIEMGKILKENGSKIKINVYGVDRTGKKQHEKFLEEINSNQLEETIVYHGHTSGPEEVLKKSFVLLRLSDDHAPWGRDVIEATTLGVPVIGLGTYEGVVTTGETGFLFEKYKADEVVNRMQLLSEQSDVWLKFHNNSISKGKNLFSGKNQRKQFESLFSSINN
jgi:glycosyltransferase involved in cell wall biosynthesis